jgi:hypothetical protein
MRFEFPLISHMAMDNADADQPSFAEGDLAPNNDRSEQANTNQLLVYFLHLKISAEQTNERSE